MDVGERATERRPRILVVDDEAREAELVTYALRRRGHAADHVCSAEACLAWMQQAPAEVALVDMMMPGMSGVELCHLLREQYPETLAIMLTGRGDVGVAVDAMRAGVYDFMTKPVMPSTLELVIARALAFMSLRDQVANVRAGVTAETPDPMSGAFRKTLALAHQIAPSDATVLITGESGTGKELRRARAARAVAARRAAPFVAVNCGAMPANLLESELFGHVARRVHRRQSTTQRPVPAGRRRHAASRRDRRDAARDAGQAAARAPAAHGASASAATTRCRSSARVIAATNRDLEAEIDERAGSARTSYYRINVVSIAVPPLRERGDDVLTLAQYLVETSPSGSASRCAGSRRRPPRKLMSYDWPGNVRELENCIERR